MNSVSAGNNLENNLPSIKYRQAGGGFLALNLIYLILAWTFIPPFNPDLSTWIYAAFYLAVIGTLSFFIYRGRKRLVQVLAILYAARSLFSTYSMVSGETFAAVPYLLPCLVLSCYLLGRAAWNWP